MAGMDLSRIDAADELRAPDRGFRLREFRRLVGLTRPFTRQLLAGIGLALVFAALHTVSIAGVFPVLRILLEREGLHGWIDRTLAEDRLGAELDRTANASGSLRILRLKANGALARAGVEADARLGLPAGESMATGLAEIARAAESAEVTLTVRVPDVDPTPRTVTVPLKSLSTSHKLLRWGASWLPADADQHKLRTLMTLLGAVIVLVLLANVCRYGGEVLVAAGVLRAMVALRAQLYVRVLGLPMSYFATQPTADLVTRFVQDVQEIQRGLLTLFGKFLREPVKVVFILGLAMALDWRITLVMLVAAPAAVGVFWTVGRKVKKAGRRLLQQYGIMIDALTTALHSLRVVKAYTAEEQEQRRLAHIDRDVLRQQIKLAKLEAFMSPALETLAVATGAVVTVWLAGRVLEADLSPAKFLGLGFVLSTLFDPLRKLSDVYVRLQRSSAGAERIFAVIDSAGEQEDDPNATPVEPLCEQLRFEGVRFRYPGSESLALRDIDLTIQRGETVAIVGPNGSGKTTLVSLLLRFFTPEHGRILYDGVDLAIVRLDSLRRQISLVTQDAVVFAGTPVENIAYGDEAPDRARVEAAARQASADAFINALPGGFDGRLGERGTTLSGGQRQRLAIARAIYRDAPVVIFDEATSQIDSESEQQIQAALARVAEGRTMIIIAHRLSTIQFAKRIVVMEAGGIIDTGSHAELLSRCPLYQTLCQTQGEDVTAGAQA